MSPTIPSTSHSPPKPFFLPYWLVAIPLPSTDNLLPQRLSSSSPYKTSGSPTYVPNHSPALTTHLPSHCILPLLTTPPNSRALTPSRYLPSTSLPTVPPLDVRIMGTRASLSEGERYAIVCESSGSRPSATITWWKNGMMMTDTKNQVSTREGG